MQIIQFKDHRPANRKGSIICQ